MTTLPSAEEVLVIGEILRLKMHKDPSLIKDRRSQLHTYSCCFVGKDLVDWLLKGHEVLSRDNAVACMRKLQENGVLHHVSDDHLFKDEFLFFRFRIDDGTFFVDPDLESYHQAIMIHQRILGDSEASIFEDVSEDGLTICSCFVAAQLVSWLVINNASPDRPSAISLCQQFLDIQVIRPAKGKSDEFMDDSTRYRFIFDIDSHPPLFKALSISEDSYRRKSVDDAIRKLGLNEGERKNMAELWQGSEEEKSGSATSSNSCSEKMISENNNKIPSLKPVVLRHVSVEELMSKDSPYHWKNIRVTSDSVGFGFVIRGDGPCYVQAVDPSGPAASAGVKVRMYIYSVNGKVVLRHEHTKIAAEIMKGNVVDLVVLQHFRISH